MTFQDLVDRELEFLVTEYGWSRVQPSSGASDGLVEFCKGPLTIAVRWGHGELSLMFSVDLEFTVSHPVFRPYVTRMFELGVIARHQGWKFIPPRDARGDQDGYIVTLEQAERRLAWEARLLQRHCAALLNGDLQVLEEITRARLY